MDETTVDEIDSSYSENFSGGDLATIVYDDVGSSISNVDDCEAISSFNIDYLEIYDYLEYYDLNTDSGEYSYESYTVDIETVFSAIREDIYNEINV